MTDYRDPVPERYQPPEVLVCAGCGEPLERREARRFLSWLVHGRAACQLRALRGAKTEGMRAAQGR